MTLPSVGYLRLEDRACARGPTWQYLDRTAAIVEPTKEEAKRFARLLERRIPPGPSYHSFVEEVWSRGYEVFLVGGTVRDVLCGEDSQDVDLVTTMPLKEGKDLMQGMFRAEPEIHDRNGFVRIGRGHATDPFIDLKQVTHADPGTPDAVFGSDLNLDVLHRDFACNAIFYDPINGVLLDPTGHGITDAESKQLTIVSDVSRRAPYHLAQVGLRFFKFQMRGFSASTETCDIIRTQFCPCLSTMDAKERKRYVKAQLLSKYPRDSHQGRLDRFRDVMREFGVGDLFDGLFAPLAEELIRG